jgi:multiple sugar transport system permease protein/putative aldouronate transport system permease protein
MHRQSFGDYLFHFFNTAFFIVFTLLCVFPFYYLFINTVSDNGLVQQGRINFFPQGFHIDNYTRLLQADEMVQSILITASRTVLGTVLMVLASALVGYLITQKEMFARKIIYRCIIITMYFNAGLIPWFLNMSMLGLTNNYWGYIIPAIVQPFNLILVKTYIESLPNELEESAFIDGAGYFTVFSRIIFPLCKPILATIAVFGAVGHWNSFIDSLIIMQGNPSLFTLQHRLYIYLNMTSNIGQMMQGGGVDPGLASSLLNNRVIQLTVSMVSIIPILMVYPLMQRYFQKGLMLGAVKG